jgi:hypothetical protein
MLRGAVAGIIFIKANCKACTRIPRCPLRKAAPGFNPRARCVSEPTKPVAGKPTLF